MAFTLYFAQIRRNGMSTLKILPVYLSAPALLGLGTKEIHFSFLFKMLDNLVKKCRFTERDITLSQLLATET
jgi:hypothetical protein